MIRNKKIIFGLVGSGKTTLYRKLNEEKRANAVEIELPQSCKDDEELKETLLRLYINNKNIETIIVHPYYLPSNWKEIVGEVKIELLGIPFEERLERIIKIVKFMYEFIFRAGKKDKNNIEQNSKK